jgi:hypothetical protein
MPAKSPKTAKPATVRAIKSSGIPAKEKPKATLRRKRTPGKASDKLTAGFLLDPKPPAKEPLISHDDIALRAYFIAERRHKMGWPGDSGTDWADAVKQLRAEALEKPLRKR